MHPEAVVTGEDVLSADSKTDDLGNLLVEFRLKPSGARKLGFATRNHQRKPLAIVVEGTVLSAPIVRGTVSEEIQMSGNFTREFVNGLLEKIR